MAYNAQNFAGRGNASSPPGTTGGFRSQGSPGGAQAGAGAAGAKRATQPIRPVTIKQVLNASHVGDGVIVIDGREASQVTVVGRVISLENANGSSGGLTAKHFGYYISDGTGTLLVRQWLDQQDHGAAVPLQLQTVVRASGTLKIWNELPLVTGSVRLVADSNEITFHLLDSILTHLRITKGPIPSSGVSSKPQTQGNPYAAAAQSAATVGSGEGGKLLVSDVITTAVRSQGGTLGLTMQQIADYASRHGFSLQDVRLAMKDMSTHGNIYQSDADHYMV